MPNRPEMPPSRRTECSERERESTRQTHHMRAFVIPRQPLLSIGMLAQIALFQPLRIRIVVGENSNVASQGDSGPGCGRRVGPDRQRSGMRGRMKDVLAMARDGKEDESERAIRITAVENDWSKRRPKDSCAETLTPHSTPAWHMAVLIGCL